jgi:hypothetical protein
LGFSNQLWQGVQSRQREHGAGGVPLGLWEGAFVVLLGRMALLKTLPSFGAGSEAHVKAYLCRNEVDQHSFFGPSPCEVSNLPLNHTPGSALHF